MGYIKLRGPIGRLAMTIIAVGGFILALGGVLDFYDAWWRFTVPATVVLGALIWIFVLVPEKGQPPPQAVWPLGLDIILGKLLMTIAILFGILGVIGLIYDLYGLILQNWHMIVVALGLMTVIVLFAMFWPSKKTGRPRAANGRAPPIVSRRGRPRPAEHDDLVS